jgi:hypothetical protein
MKQITWMLALIVTMSALVIAGCVGSPSSSPTIAPTVGPSPTATPIPSPTLIGGNDQANIQFYYQLGSGSQYSGLQPSSPGDLLYILQVNVTSDKPVQTSQDWFWMEYRANASDSIHDSHASISFVTYPNKIISSNTTSARGEMIFELSATMAQGYPKPYYYMPTADQQGPYYVYSKVYGTVGDVQ